jgi:type IV secretory pathway VirJ component
MFMRVYSPLKMQQSYNARKSAVVDITAGGDGFRQVPLRTTSAQEGELDLILVVFWGAGGWRSAV